jgi:hypothetical protein
MHNNGVEKCQTPIDCYTQDHNVDKEGYNNVLEEYRMAFDKFSCPERVEKSLGKIGDGIIFQAGIHSY